MDGEDSKSDWTEIINCITCKMKKCFVTMKGLCFKKKKEKKKNISLNN